MAKKRSQKPTPKTRTAKSGGRSGARQQTTKSSRKSSSKNANSRPGKKTTRPLKKSIRKSPVARGRRPSGTQRRPASHSDELRLQRFLAKAGFGSRRECEELITTGRVFVDGEPVQELGTKVNPEKQKVVVDGQRVVPERLEYFILNKPPGVLSTSRDPEGRLRVIDLIQSRSRVYNVGRLDKSSEGLILVTNDGDLANRLTHPSYGIAKTYHVQVEGEPSKETLKQLVEGVYLAEGFAKMANVKFKKRQKNTTWLEIVLEEGRNREIRRLLARVGHKVLKLRRVAIGPLRLGELPLGAHRRLDAKEIRALKYAKSANAGSTSKSKKPGKKRTSAPKSRSDSQESRSGSRKDSPTRSNTKKASTKRPFKKASSLRADDRPTRKKRPTKKKAPQTIKSYKSGKNKSTKKVSPKAGRSTGKARKKTRK